ncbi:MAG: hypothetical protein M3388_16745 [Acidobacteriota bacterium]|nr:hypothetical protein [Acidobacteriota bacterium]
MRKKKSDKNTEQPEKKSRAKYQCPIGLARFIEELHLVFPKVDLRDKNVVFEENELPRRPDISEEERHNLLFERNKKVLEECVKDFDGDYARVLFSKFYPVWREANPDAPEYYLKNLALFDALDAYEKFRELRGYLQSIARFFAQLRAGNIKRDNKREIETNDGKVLKFPDPPGLLSREGTIGKIGSEIFETFIGLDLDRIRECGICSRIFWAKNKNSQTCSGPCRNALRQRKHRKKNKEKINADRRRNYQNKKNLKNGKERAKKWHFINARTQNTGG